VAISRYPKKGLSWTIYLNPIQGEMVMPD